MFLAFLGIPVNPESLQDKHIFGFHRGFTPSEKNLCFPRHLSFHRGLTPSEKNRCFPRHLSFQRG